MTGNNVGIGHVPLHEFNGLTGNIAVACPVKSVTANTVFIIKLPGNTVEVGCGGKGLMKGCVKYSYLGDSRQQLHCFPDSCQIGRIMQRGQFNVLLYGFNYFSVYFYRRRILFSAVYYPVPHTGRFHLWT